MSKIVVIDFETTGLSPGLGDRATDVAAVIIDDNKIIDRFQSLINAGVAIPAYRKGTNKMRHLVSFGYLNCDRRSK